MQNELNTLEDDGGLEDDEIELNIYKTFPYFPIPNLLNPWTRNM